MDRKNKKLIKKMKYSKQELDSLLCGDITDDQLSAAKRTKTDFIHSGCGSR